MPQHHASLIGLGITLTTPAADGSPSHVLVTDGSGVLSFQDVTTLPGMPGAGTVDYSTLHWVTDDWVENVDFRTEPVGAYQVVRADGVSGALFRMQGTGQGVGLKVFDLAYDGGNFEMRRIADDQLSVLYTPLSVQQTGVTIWNVDSAQTNQMIWNADTNILLQIRATAGSVGQKNFNIDYANGQLAFQRLDDAFGFVSSPFLIDSGNNAKFAGNSAPIVTIEGAFNTDILFNHTAAALNSKLGRIRWDNGALKVDQLTDAFGLKRSALTITSTGQTILKNAGGAGDTLVLDDGTGALYNMGRNSTTGFFEIHGNQDGFCGFCVKDQADVDLFCVDDAGVGTFLGGVTAGGDLTINNTIKNTSGTFFAQSIGGTFELQPATATDTMRFRLNQINTRGTGEIVSLDFEKQGTAIASIASNDSTGDLRINLVDSGDVMRLRTRIFEDGRYWIANSTATNVVEIGDSGQFKIIADGVSGEQLLLYDRSGFHYDIGRSSGTGFLEFQGFQAGFVGYSFLDETGASLFGINDAGDAIATGGLSVNGGFIELLAQGGSPFIDFKDDSGDDFDVRIQQISDGLQFSATGPYDFRIGGQIRYFMDANGSHSFRNNVGGVRLAIDIDNTVQVIDDTAGVSTELIIANTSARGTAARSILRYNKSNSAFVFAGIIDAGLGNGVDYYMDQTGAGDSLVNRLYQAGNGSWFWKNASAITRMELDNLGIWKHIGTGNTINQTSSDTAVFTRLIDSGSALDQKNMDVVWDGGQLDHRILSDGFGVLSTPLKINSNGVLVDANNGGVGSLTITSAAFTILDMWRTDQGLDAKYSRLAWAGANGWQFQILGDDFATDVIPWSVTRAFNFSDVPIVLRTSASANAGVIGASSSANGGIFLVGTDDGSTLSKPVEVAGSAVIVDPPGGLIVQKLNAPTATAEYAVKWGAEQVLPDGSTGRVLQAGSEIIPSASDSNTSAADVVLTTGVEALIVTTASTNNYVPTSIWGTELRLSNTGSQRVNFTVVVKLNGTPIFTSPNIPLTAGQIQYSESGTFLTDPIIADSLTVHVTADDSTGNRVPRVLGATNASQLRMAQLTGGGGGGSSDWVKISSTTIAAPTATVDITSGIDSTYKRYVITIDGMTISDNTVDFMMRHSTDGGSNFDSGVSSYSYTVHSADGGGNTQFGDADHPQVNLSGQPKLGNIANHHSYWWIELWLPSSATLRTATTHRGGYTQTNVNFSPVTISGSSEYRATTAAVNAIRFLLSAGNITGGTFTLYGVN